MDSANEMDEKEVKQLAKTLATVFRNDEDFTATMDESLEKENLKNPMLFSPVIRCVLGFLNLKDIKNCRLISREWGSTGKLVLASRALIRFQDNKYRRPIRRLADFQSCFLNSATLFSAFDFCSQFTKENCRHPWSIEELTEFFVKHLKYVKELGLKFQFSDENLMKNIDIGSWISKSPLVQRNAKYLTKLTIEGHEIMLDIPPLHLISHIKDLTLTDCRINLEAGITLCPIKLRLGRALIFQDGIKLDGVRINDFVDLCRANEVSLCSVPSYFGVDEENPTEYIVDFWGNVALDNLEIDWGGILNGETSQWTINHLKITDTTYSLNSQIEIKELSFTRAGTIDLFTLPHSIQKLAIKDIEMGSTVICTQPVVLENLQYLHLSGNGKHETSHFMNCPQLFHLKLVGSGVMEIHSLRMPKTVKTLTLYHCYMNWDQGSYLNLEKLVVDSLDRTNRFKNAQKLSKTKIGVENLVMYNQRMKVEKSLVDFLKYGKRLSFGKRVFIGKLEWGEMKFEDSALNEHADEKSPFYVFENGRKERAFSEKAFHELADIPKHL